MKIDIEQYPWLALTLEELKLREKNGLAHAIIFSSPKGFGKSHIAYYFSNWLLCEKKSILATACHECQTCIWFESLNHPDFHQIKKANDKKNISIESIRNLITDLSQTSHQEGWKIALIHDAELMTSAASNALLKTLEEPTKNTLFILLVNRIGLIPLTIISRCQQLSISQPNNTLIINWLIKQTSQTADDCQMALTIAENSPFYALKVLNENTLTDYKSWYLDLKKLQNNEIGTVDLIDRWEKLECIQINWLNSLLNTKITKTKNICKIQEYILWFDYQQKLIKAEDSWQKSLNSTLILQMVYSNWQYCYQKNPI